jgi:hypothetical protein
VSRLCAFSNRDLSPGSVAQILWETKGLEAERVTEFLLIATNHSTLVAFFKAVPMRVPLVEAMRRAMSGPFVLPETPEDINRALRAFATSYFEQNPRVFGTMFDVLTMTYALVMLNTELQRPDFEERVACNDFVSILGNALGHSRIPRAHISKVYNALKAKPFAFVPKPVEVMASCTPKKCGWLRKKSIRQGGAWVMHYFVLKNATLCYYPNTLPENRSKPLGKVQLVDVDIREDSHSDKRFFVVARSDQIQYLKLRTGEPALVEGVKSLLFEARSKEVADDWLFRIRRGAVMECFLRGVRPPPKNTANNDTVTIVTEASDRELDDEDRLRSV